MKRFMSFACAFVLAAFGGVSALAQTSWTLDKAHSGVKFAVSHMVVSEVEGSFKMFDGSLKAKDDTFEDAQVEFTADAKSLSTDNERRDNHLRSDDFFNAEKFPQLKFVGKSFKKSGNNQYKLTGDLTIRDVTKTVTFDVTSGGTIALKDGVKAGFKATATIDRLEYNLKWNKLLEAGGAVVGKEVKISVNVELDKKKS